MAGGGTPGSEPCHRRVIILVKFEVARGDVNGDELAVVLRPKRWPNLPVKYFNTDARKFLSRTMWTSSGHR